MILRLASAVLLFAAATRSVAADPVPGSLEARLLDEGIAALASAAETKGDARRGAVAFHQPTLACARCHSTNGKPGSVGPDLTTWTKAPSTAHLVESMLDPSKSIRKGFESAVVVRVDGRTVNGVLVEATAKAVVIRDASGKTVSTPVDQIDEWTKSPQSTMPRGVVNQLGTRQQFLDIVRYVREVADGGVERARELQPPAALLVARALPEYEARVDHAGLIRELDAGAFERGREIYERTCANCHGTHDRPGTLPTSRKFGREPLKNGSDPYAMYQTLTRGFGMMVPQHWMVPRQKYDVVHYVREDYLKDKVAATPRYLLSLPKGDTFGPAPSRIREWSAMDYGPSLVNTYEIGNDGHNFAYKGIATRLDPGSGGVARGRAWAVFEHDTLRLAGFWTGKGFIDWNGIHFNGRHGIHPRAVGDVHLENVGPGWANPETGRFTDDQRIVGRDKRIYGPLPRKWGRYEGQYAYGPQTIVRYNVGGTSVLETPGFLEVGEGDAKTPVLTRSFEVGPRDGERIVAIATHPEKATALLSSDAGVLFAAGDPTQPAPEPATAKVTFNGTNYLEVPDGRSLNTNESFTVTARIRTTKGGTIFARTAAGPEWVPGGQVLFVRGGRLSYDIGWVGVLNAKANVADGKWHDVALVFERKRGIATLFVDGRDAGSKRFQPEAAIKKPVVRIGYCAPDFPKPTAFVGDIADVRYFATPLAPQDFADAKPLAHWKPTAETRAGRIPNLVGKKYAAAVKAVVANPVAASSAASGVIVAGGSGLAGLEWKQDGKRLCLALPPGDETLRFTVWTANVDSREVAGSVLANPQLKSLPTPELSAMTEGGPPRWPQTLTTESIVGEPHGNGPFAVDVLAHPTVNPWLARVRLTGFDFFEDANRAAVSAWDGDVWLVEGLQSDDGKLTWKRIASGLFQPLGVKIVDETIYVTCRDQLAILHDRNGDGEVDFVQSFNSDHQVTEHFHEFAMGLQRDEAGNFYYAKSARHALPALVPHHGTLLRISPDGSRTDILATGFRAANGVCLNPDGTFFVTDQEGHWTPKNRINWVREGGFYGNMMGYHDVTDPSNDAMQPPLCWITNSFDRSPAELLWVKGSKWGPLEGRLLNLSYGYGKIYVVPHEKLGTGAETVMQGGMSPLPIPNMPTGLVRGRFHPEDGQLYACGMFAWAGNQQAPGGFYRIRHTGRPTNLPVEFHGEPGQLRLGFTDPLDTESATRPGNFTVRVWSLKRSRGYGSKHIDERTLKITKATLAEDGKTVTLTIPNLGPTMGMAVNWEIESPTGTPIKGELHGTIHER